MRIWIWQRALFRLCAAALLAPALFPGHSAQAGQFYLGEPARQNNLWVVPSYATGVRLERDAAKTDRKTIELEVDVRAARGEEHGFSADSWIPYLTIQYQLRHGGSRFATSGVLRPVIGRDGLRYASSVAVDGPGTYHLTLRVHPPRNTALARRIDPETGVSPWWHPFTLTWIFTYPSRPL